MKHYLVVGRMCGDDEDTGITYHVETKAEAVSLYVEDLWENYFDNGGWMEGSRDETRDLIEANGEGVFINSIWVSDAPIKEAT